MCQLSTHLHELYGKYGVYYDAKILGETSFKHFNFNLKFPNHKRQQCNNERNGAMAFIHEKVSLHNWTELWFQLKWYKVQLNHYQTYSNRLFFMVKIV